MERSYVSATAQGAPGAKQSKGHVTGVFWFWGYRTPRVRFQRQTINKEFYVEVLLRLLESVCRKRPEQWRDGDWILHRDNAPAHTSHLVQQFLAKHGPLSCSSRHTHQILYRVTFSFSQGSRKFWKDTELRQRRTSNEIRRRNYWTSRKGVRKMFPIVPETLGEVCSCGSELCWRQG